MLKKYKLMLELVKKTETEHGTIGLLESWKMMKDFWKLAKKHNFDCYVKGYPASKLDYVPTGKTILIKTVEDIAELTPEQFEFFIDDLRSWCEWRRELKSANETLSTIGIDAFARIIESQEWMTWIDSWMHEKIIKMEVGVTNNLSQ